VIHAGVLADVDMPSLYRLADTLVFASVREGFGLVVLEAMASGLPVIASHIPPFTEYLTDDEVVWCDPHSIGSIANAMATVLAEPLRSLLSAKGYRVARRHDWPRTARAHLPVYVRMQEMHHA
jgi:glycosyltransferase involved in cell wall biosynthesis